MAELVQDLGHAQGQRQQKGVVDAEKLVELGQLGAENVELRHHQQQRGEGQQHAKDRSRQEKNQRT